MAIVGLLTWLILTYVPMPAEFKKIVLAIAVFATVLWLLNGFGFFVYLR